VTGSEHYSEAESLISRAAAGDPLPAFVSMSYERDAYATTATIRNLARCPSGQVHTVAAAARNHRGAQAPPSAGNGEERTGRGG
jgi:hypothetical protein